MFTEFFIVTVIRQSGDRLWSMLNGEGTNIMERVVMTDS